MKKRTAPAPPPTTYGTLPHAPRHSQNLDNELFGVSSQHVLHGLHHHHPDMYSTLPHLRGSDPISNNSASSVPAALLSSEMRGGSTKSMQAQLLFDNKIFDRYEPYTSSGAAVSVGSGNRDPNFLSTFTGGHKRSPSGESLGRNLGMLYSRRPKHSITNCQHIYLYFLQLALSWSCRLPEKSLN